MWFRAGGGARRGANGSVAHAQLLSRLEIYLAAVPSVAWFAVLVELSRPRDSWRARTRELLLVAGVGALTLFGAMMAGSVDGPLRPVTC